MRIVRLKLAIIVALSVMLIFAELNGKADTKEEIIVSAAASLTSAMTNIAREFEKRNIEIKVTLNFASSGSLLQQMIHGAPVDVFASANQKFMNKALKKRLILPATRINFARNRLVLAVPQNSKIAIKTIYDLLSPEIRRIALGNPEHAPVGGYSRESLQAHGLWEKLSSKFIFANSAPQIWDYLNREEVDVGIFYFTDAGTGGGKVKIITKIGKHQPILYPAAVLSSSDKTESAGHFVNFLLSDKGREILALCGFKNP